MAFFPRHGNSADVPFGITAGAAFVFLVILAALILFATEPVPVDITAIGVLVALLLVAIVAAVGGCALAQSHVAG